MDIVVCLESAVTYSKRECHLASEKKKSEEVRVRENWSRKQRVKGEKGGTDRKKEKDGRNLEGCQLSTCTDMTKDRKEI